MFQPKTIHSQTPNYEGWTITLNLIKEAMIAQEKIDWQQLITALNHFPEKFRCASNGIHLWSQPEFAPILQIFNRYIVHRATYTAKFGLFSSSAYNFNIERIALDYRESDDDYVGLGSFMRCKTLKKLSHLRIKNIYLTDGEVQALTKSLDNFPALEQVDLIGHVRYEKALIEALKKHGVTIRTARHYRDFVDCGFDFWK